ncbi:HEAT repeat domain-containing protein [Streptomyces sp. NPDC014734]|uniref:HEAT repeat domain-containing protein n=1 Tax=Streptomyces sp. NPDC014734 TaxID=3364886 RepID=UPI0036FB2CA5
MLETFDTVDWANLPHAYGPATDVPGQLRALGSAERGVREKALGELNANIVHQGSRYLATAPAVPFLLELLADPSTPIGPEILGLLARLAIGDDHSPLDGYAISVLREAAEGGPELLADAAAQVSMAQEPHPARPEPSADTECEDEEEDEEEDEDEEDDLLPIERYVEDLPHEEQTRIHAFVELAAYDAVRAGLPLVRSLLDAEDAAVRTAAAHLLAWFPEEAATALPALERIVGDPDPVVAATALVAVGRLAEPGPARAPRLLDDALDDPRDLVRWGAATALARLNGPRADRAVADALRERVSRDTERGEEVPFFDGDVRGYAARSLCLLGDDHIDETLTTLLARLPEISGGEALHVAGAALRLAFPERPLSAGTPFATLHDRQRRLIRALADSPGTWRLGGRPFGNFAALMRTYGLPTEVDALAAYATGARTEGSTG